MVFYPCAPVGVTSADSEVLPCSLVSLASSFFSVASVFEIGHTPSADGLEIPLHPVGFVVEDLLPETQRPNQEDSAHIV